MVVTDIKVFILSTSVTTLMSCVLMFDNLRADEFKCAFAHGLEEVYVQS